MICKRNGEILGRLAFGHAAHDKREFRRMIQFLPSHTLGEEGSNKCQVRNDICIFYHCMIGGGIFKWKWKTSCFEIDNQF